jgi:hypothetical protein
MRGERFGKKYRMAIHDEVKVEPATFETGLRRPLDNKSLINESRRSRIAGALDMDDTRWHKNALWFFFWWFFSH